MAERERLTVDDVAKFFDDLAQDYLDPFNWDPNPSLPKNIKKIYTIKDFFKAKYYDRHCLYFKDEKEICRINFHDIFSSNLIYLSQIDDIQNKIKRIVNSDNFFSTNTMTRNSNSTSSVSSNMSNNSTAKVNNFDRYGSFRGEIDATQLPKGLESTRRLIETKQIIEKSDDKIMDYLIPSRNITHNVNIEKRDDTTLNTFTANNSTTNSGSGSSNMTHRRGTVALSEMQALGVRIRQLRSEFLELFNPLFHAI